MKLIFSTIIIFLCLSFLSPEHFYPWTTYDAEINIFYASAVIYFFFIYNYKTVIKVDINILLLFLLVFVSIFSFNYYIWHQFIAVKMCEWGLPYSASPQPNLDADKPWQWAYTLCAFGFPLIVSVVLTFGFERPIARYGARKYKTFCVGRSENNRSTRFFKEEMNS